MVTVKFFSELDTGGFDRGRCGGILRLSPTASCHLLHCRSGSARSLLGQPVGEPLTLQACPMSVCVPERHYGRPDVSSPFKSARGRGSFEYHSRITRYPKPGSHGW